MTLRLTIIYRVRRSPSKGGVGVSEWKRGSRTGANGRWAAAAGTFVELAASALVEADAGTTLKTTKALAEQHNKEFKPITAASGVSNVEHIEVQ